MIIAIVALHKIRADGGEYHGGDHQRKWQAGICAVMGTPTAIESKKQGPALLLALF